VEISLPIRNRRNSFVPSHSDRDDMTVETPEESLKSGMDKSCPTANML
jgi:hypothetical protein